MTKQEIWKKPDDWKKDHDKYGRVDVLAKSAKGKVWLTRLDSGGFVWANDDIEEYCTLTDFVNFCMGK